MILWKHGHGEVMAVIVRPSKGNLYNIIELFEGESRRNEEYPHNGGFFTAHKPNGK
jgi:hypothetical protein